MTHLTREQVADRLAKFFPGVRWGIHSAPEDQDVVGFTSATYTTVTQVGGLYRATINCTLVQPLNPFQVESSGIASSPEVAVEIASLKLQREVITIHQTAEVYGHHLTERFELNRQEDEDADATHRRSL